MIPTKIISALTSRFFFYQCLFFSVCINTSSFAANIKVTTTVDEVKIDSECSLREAVAFLNEGLSDIDSDCYPEDENPSRIIELNTEKEYQLDSELLIKTTMSIQSNLANDISNQDGKKITLLNAPKSRAMVIDDNSSFQNATVVNIKGIEIRGAFHEKNSGAKATVIADEGGLIYNREVLSLERVKLSGGGADKGGAIFNASLDSNLKIKDSELTYNTAYQGAAVYSEHERYAITGSLFTKNKQLSDLATNASGFVIETLTSYPVKVINSFNSASSYVLARKGKVANSIFYDNTKLGAMNIVAGIEANNLTIINNGAGVLLDSDFSFKYEVGSADSKIIASYLANSVILNNSDYDISVDNDDLTFINHLLVGQQGIKGTKPSIYQHSVNELPKLQVDNLIASKTVTDDDGNTRKICLAPTSTEIFGLFCPLIKQSDEFIANLKPRLLMTYTAIEDSPIVNAGAQRNINQNKDALECEINDMRGEVRQKCDLGAYELSVNKKQSSRIKTVNAEIPYGGIATLTTKDISGDGQLLPAAECSKYIENPPENANLWLSGVVNEWTDGCVTFVSGASPKKGKLTLAENKDALLYTPDEEYHGIDEFEYQLITTTTRFSEAYNDKIISAKSVIYQYPNDTFKSSKIKLGYSEGGGSMHWHFLLALFAMLGISFVITRKSY